MLHPIGSSEAAVCRFCLSISPLPSSDDHIDENPGWVSCLALLCGNGTSSSDDLSVKVSIVAYTLFTPRGSSCASLMVIIIALWVESLLSLPLSEVFKPMTGCRSLR